MKIAIVGAGNVGGTLGRVWAAKGHEVRYGSRKPDPADPSQTAIRQAAAFGEVVVLATPWEAVRAAIEACGDLTGKILVDCTNPLLPGLAGLELGTSTSGAETAAALCSAARVVKAFNTVGYNVMANPLFNGIPATMFYCGDDEAAKAAVHKLAEDCGFAPVDAGPLQQARLLEPFALLWISLALQRGFGRQIAFSLVHR